MIVPSTPWRGEAVAQHYDELDRFYRELWGEHVHHGLWRSGNESSQQATEQLIRSVAAYAQLRPGAAVCDVGMGYGGTARFLAQHYGARVTALTISPRQLAYARSQPQAAGSPAVNYLLQDWLANSFREQAFDTLIAIESTEHMPDLARCFQEAYRVLRPGGRLAVCAWLAREDASAWEIRALLEPICREGRLAALGTASEYRELIEQAGFHVEQHVDLSAAVRRTWAIVLQRMFSGLASQAQYWNYLLDRRQRERIFSLTVPRMWLAYRLGSLHYAIIVARRPVYV